MTLLGKSNPKLPLESHLRDVRDCASRLLTPARRAAFERLGISSSRAEELLLSAAWLHDWGKGTREWQSAIARGRKPPQHSLSSFFACRWALDIRPSEMSPDLLAMQLAVLAHHGQLHNGAFDGNSPKFAHEEITFHLDAWRAWADELPFGFTPNASLQEGKPFLASKICTMVDEARERVRDIILSGEMETFRGLYCLLLALLVEADHTASGGVLATPYILNAPRLPKDKETGNYSKPTAFQDDVQMHAAEILCAIAGCGSGKTAAALLRTAELAAAHRVDRIVLCLPTRFTSNSLLRDMSDTAKYSYARQHVGLVHAEALQVLREHEAQTGDEESSVPNSPEERAAYAVRFEAPITISTIDHLLMSCYHGYKYSDRAFGNLLSALVVFDEIHAYDTITLNAIREGSEVLQRHGVPCLFMSATLPASRRRFFNLGEGATVRETDNPFVPFIARKLQEPLTRRVERQEIVSESAREIIRKSHKLKLAIYVNQVERAKALCRVACEEVGRERVYCYHSELAPKDRIQLEKQIIEAFQKDEPVLLIATQAAELSLDISAERMLTELAPADVLVQRSGRLHRRGLSPQKSEDESARLPNNFVYELLVAPLDWQTGEPQDDDPIALPYKEAAVLERTWELAPWDEEFTFARGLEWCEQVLVDDVPQRRNGIDSQSVEDAVFGKRPQENFNGESDGGGVVIRDIEPSRSVVPYCYYADLPDDLTQLARYFVPLRRKKYFRLKNVMIETTTPVILRRGSEKEEEINYPIVVANETIPYDPQHGGFDFSEAPVKDEEAGGAFFDD